MLNYKGVFSNFTRPQFYPTHTINAYSHNQKSQHPCAKRKPDKKYNTVAPPGGYSSLPGGLSHQEPNPHTNWWTAWRHMHARQAVSGQNPENAKTTHIRQRIHSLMITQDIIW